MHGVNYNPCEVPCIKAMFIIMVKGSILCLSNLKGVLLHTVLWLLVFMGTPPCLVKNFLVMNMGIMARVLFKFINISNVFMVLPMTWAEDRTMCTQVEPQQDEVVLAYMFKKRSKRLQNTNSFLLVECISAAWRDNSLVCVMLAESFLSTEHSRIFPSLF